MEVEDNQPKAPQAMSDDDLAAIRSRCELATPGTWESYIEGRDMWGGSDVIVTGGEDIYLSGATKADQDFIAHARQDVPKLLHEIQRLRSLLGPTNA